jgi:hypothetical protein
LPNRGSSPLNQEKWLNWITVTSKLTKTDDKKQNSRRVEAVFEKSSQEKPDKVTSFTRFARDDYLIPKNLSISQFSGFCSM